MNIEGRRVYLRPLEDEDAIRIRQWKKNDHPLFIGYDYGSMTEAESWEWLSSRRGARRKYFAVDILGRSMIGYLGIRDVNPFRKRAVLGIVFDPAYQSCGYGQEALELFLEYYFSVQRMRLIDLEVNQFNQRAIELYRRMGFYIVSEKQERFENPSLDFSDPRIAPYADCFFRANGVLYALLWKMRKEAPR